MKCDNRGSHCKVEHEVLAPKGQYQMKRYNVKIGNHVADGDGYATIAEAKREIKKLKHADDTYDISRSDGYYKVVEREVGPWIKTKGIAQKAPESEQCTPPVAQKTTKVEQPGNVAALREACQKTRDLLMQHGDGKNRCVLTWDEFNSTQKMLRAALTTPARNCDRFARAKEARDAFDATYFGATDFGFYEVAFINWLFAPAKENGGNKQ